MPPNLDRPSLIQMLQNGKGGVFLLLGPHATSGRDYHQSLPKPMVCCSVRCGWSCLSNGRALDDGLQKARLFNDDEALEQIIIAPEPRAAKALGRTVRNFDEIVWKANARRFVT